MSGQRRVNHNLLSVDWLNSSNGQLAIDVIRFKHKQPKIYEVVLHVFQKLIAQDKCFWYSFIIAHQSF